MLKEAGENSFVCLYIHKYCVEENDIFIISMQVYVAQ